MIKERIVNIFQRYFQGLAIAVICMLSFFTGCVVPGIRYFRASNPNPELMDTISITWKAEGLTLLRISESYTAQKLFTDFWGWGYPTVASTLIGWNDSGGRYYPSASSYPTEDGVINYNDFSKWLNVKDSGRIILYPPQWNRDFYLECPGIGIGSGGLSLSVRVQLDSSLILDWPAEDDRPAEASVYQVDMWLIGKHQYHEAALYLSATATSSWPGTSSELSKLSSKSIDSRSGELFKAVANVVWDYARNACKPKYDDFYDSIDFWQDNPFLNPNLLSLFGRSGSMDEFKFLLTHDTDWMLDYRHRVDSAILDEALWELTDTGTSLDSTRSEILSLLKGAGARSPRRVPSRALANTSEGTRELIFIQTLNGDGYWQDPSNPRDKFVHRDGEWRKAFYDGNCDCWR